MKIFTFSLLFLLILYSSSFANDIWQITNGPFKGGEVLSSAAMSGNRFIAATNTGIFISSADCEKWIHQFKGLYNLDSLNIAVKDSVIVIAGKYVCGDVGGRGIIVFPSPDQCYIREFTHHNNNSNINVIIDNNGIIYGSDRNSFFLTENTGQTWIKIDNAPTDIKVLALDSSNVLLAGTQKGLFYSDDNGKAWLSAGLNEEIYKMTVTSSGFIAVITPSGTRVDNSIIEMWPLLSTDTLPEIRCLSSVGDVLYAGTVKGIYTLDLKQKNWIKTSFPEYEICSISPNGIDNILVGTKGNGLFMLNSKKNTWVEKNNLIFNLHVNDLKCNSKNEVFALADRNGVYKTTDKGDTWLPLDTTNTDFLSMVINRDTLFAVARNKNSICYLPKDESEWKTAESDVKFNYIANDSWGNVYANNSKGIYIYVPSSNRMESFYQFHDPASCAIFGFDRDSNLFFATGESDKPNKLFKLDLRNNRLDSLHYNDNNVQIVKMVISETGTIYINISLSGILYSKDKGITWRTVGGYGSPGCYAYDFFVIPYNNGKEDCIYISTGTPVNAYHFGRSYNYGKDWVDLESGLDDPVTYSHTTDNNGYIYVGTREGVYRTIENKLSIQDDKKSTNSEVFARIYPNPATDYIFIHSYENIDLKITVSNTYGEVINSYSTNDNKISINTGDLPDGIYFIRIKAGEKSETVKIAVLH